MAARKQIRDQTIANLALRRLRGESLDKIADEIVMISDAVKKMMSSQLNEDTLLLLIQNAIGANQSTKYRPVPMKTIKAVIGGMMALQDTHLKSKEQKK